MCIFLDAGMFLPIEQGEKWVISVMSLRIKRRHGNFI